MVEGRNELWKDAVRLSSNLYSYKKQKDSTTAGTLTNVPLFVSTGLPGFPDSFLHLCSSRNGQITLHAEAAKPGEGMQGVGTTLGK